MRKYLMQPCVSIIPVFKPSPIENMAKDHPKRPKVKKKISISKKPKAFPPKEVNFTWSYQKFDAQGPFKKTNLQKFSVEEVFEKQKNFETSNYRLLGYQGSHFVSVEKIVKDAQKDLNN